MSTPKMSASQRLVYDVLERRQRNGHTDTTDSEIQEVLERLHSPRRFDRAWISGRVSEMKALGLLLESPARRADDNTRWLASRGRSAAMVRATYIPGAGAAPRPVIAPASAVADGGCY